MGERRGQPPAGLDRHHLVLGRPNDQHRPGEASQARIGLDQLPPSLAGVAGVLAQVPPDRRIGQGRLQPLVDQLVGNRHFRDRSELVAATLEPWERRDTTEVVAALETIAHPRERLRELARSAYLGAAAGNDAQSGVLAAASDPRVAPVLERVTRTRLAFLEHQFQALGLDPPAAHTRARMAYALYVGLGDLRRAAPQAPMTESEAAAIIELILDTRRSRPA